MEKHNEQPFDVSISFDKWRQIPQPPNSPSPRHLHSIVHSKNYLYLFGGYGDGEKYLDDFWRYSLPENSWKKIKSKTRPTPRHSHQAVVWKDKMILFGGISEGKTMNDLWSFDFASESWTQERTLHRVSGHSMTVVADKIIIFGGADENTHVTDKLIVLDADTLDVVQVTVDNPPPPRQYASMIAHNDAIYLFGGLNNDNKSLNDFYKLSLNNNDNNSIHITTEALTVSSIVPCLSGASLSVLPHQSELVLFGGQTDNKLNNTAFAFDIRSSKWRACTSIGPSPRYHQQTITISGAIYIFGGLSMSSKKDKTTNLNDMWVFAEPLSEPVDFDCPSLPVEIWSLILRHLDSGCDISGTSVVSKQFYDIIMTTEDLKGRLRSYIAHQNMFVPPITNNTLKIMTIGKNRSGASSSARRFAINMYFDEYESIFDENFRKTCIVKGHSYVINIIDANSAEEFSAMAEVVYRLAHGVYLVYSINSRDSFNELDDCIKLAKKIKLDRKFPLIIVGNKSDLESERQVSQDEGKEYAKKHDAMWIETSAKTGHNVKKAFTMLAEAVVAAEGARTRKLEDARAGKLKEARQHSQLPAESKSKKEKDRCAMM